MTYKETSADRDDFTRRYPHGVLVEQEGGVPNDALNWYSAWHMCRKHRVVEEVCRDAVPEPERVAFAEALAAEDYRFDLIHDAVGEETVDDRLEQIDERVRVGTARGAMDDRDFLAAEVQRLRDKVARVETLASRWQGAVRGLVGQTDAGAYLEARRYELCAALADQPANITRCDAPDPSDPRAEGCTNRRGHGPDKGHQWSGALRDQPARRTRIEGMSLG